MKTVAAKLYPTPGQERNMLLFLGVSRWVYNRALEQRIKAYRRRGESPTYIDQTALLTGWRTRMQWIRDVPMAIERDALRRVDRGMKAFFRRVKAGQTPGFPRFKGRDRWRSFEILQPGTYLRRGSAIHIVGVGSVKYRGMMPFVGKIKGIRVSRTSRGWRVHLIVDTGMPPDLRPVERSAGIDVGLTHFATISSGEKIGNPRWYRHAQSRLRFLQRRVARKRRRSRRRRSAVLRLAVFQEKIADTRRDWLHKLTSRLVREYDLIAVEDLNVMGLARSRNAKSVLDAAWSAFAWQLEYKAESAGVRFVRVDPRGTSQECSGCGEIVPKLLSERVHRCEGCGLVLDRDENAARNILGRVPPEVTRGERCRPKRRLRNREVLQAHSAEQASTNGNGRGSAQLHPE